MSAGLRTADVARVLAVSPDRVRAMVRAGWCIPARDGRNLRFAFQDVVLLRTALELRAARVPPARVKRALRELVRQLPAGRPLSGVRISAAGGRVVARTGRDVWQPEDGQLQFAFTVDELARRARPVRVLPTPRRRGEPPRLTANDWFEHGLALEEDDPQAARAAYGEAVALEPAHADAWVNLGRLLHEADDAAGAARCYHEALVHNEIDPVTHFNLGLACEDLDRPADAAAHYRRAIALRPDFADAHYNLSQLLSRLGERDAAVRHMVRYRQITKQRRR